MSRNEDGRPNILFVMADDHAANAIGAYDAHLADVAPTSHIDRIATEGTRLDNCVCTNSICTPSRASILTGEHGHRNGVRTLSDRLDPDRTTVAHRLQEAGYETAVVGKWHLKTEPSGFDYYNVLPGQGRYHDPYLKEIGDEWQDGDAGGTTHEGYSADVITDQSIQWLEGRPDEDPFFLMCQFKAPHEPWQYPDRHEDLFDGVTIPEPPTLWEDKSHRSAATRQRGSTMSPDNSLRNMVEQVSRESWPTGSIDTAGMTDDERTRAAYRKHLADYLRCVAAIDDNVGRLLAFLEESGRLDDTVVVYTSDQGMLLGEHDYIDKRWMFEESLRMPFLARYPPEIDPGSTRPELLANVDFAPTFLEYAGVDTPDSMQGRSGRDVLAGDPPADWRSSVYYRYWMHRAHHDVPAHYGLRTDRYKLVYYYGLPLDAAGARDTPTAPGWELYDLDRDPLEQYNVYDDPGYADVRADLKEELRERKRELEDTDAEYPALRDRNEKHF